MNELLAIWVDALTVLRDSMVAQPWMIPIVFASSIGVVGFGLVCLGVFDNPDIDL